MEDLKKYEEAYEKWEHFSEAKLGKKAQLVKQGLIDMKWDLGIKQLDDTNFTHFAQWMLRTAKRENKVLFKKYMEIFKKNGIITGKLVT